MLSLEVSLFVIQMACTSTQQTATILEPDAHELVLCDESTAEEQTIEYDESARKMRKHLAQEEALRQLERRKARALAAVHRLSFMR